MKIAIMGAGLSGLSCAITLERLGIKPTIFENRKQVGDRFINGEAFLSIITNPIHDVIAHFSEQFQLFLKPTSNIKEMIIHSKNERAAIKGHLGFINIRGRHEKALERQLADQLHSSITFNSTHSYEQLLQDYSHVVMATGDAAYAAKIQPFTEDLFVSIKGATVEGTFNRHSVHIWLNNDVAPKGYAYLLPFSDHEANIAIAYPSHSIDDSKVLERCWNHFINIVQNDLNQNLQITDNFHITDYIIGQCKYPRIGNTFFAGNCFGSIMPFIGFGQYQAILTGIYVAYDLTGNGQYEQLTKQIHKDYQHSLVLRRAMEKLDNQHFDKIVKHLNGTIGEKMFNSPHLNPLRIASFLIRPFINS